jgi:hypothetical protein
MINDLRSKSGDLALRELDKSAFVLGCRCICKCRCSRLFMVSGMDMLWDSIGELNYFYA